MRALLPPPPPVGAPVLGFLLAMAGGPLTAQAPTDYVELSEKEEIALARSAAPAAVSKGATIWVLRDGHFQVAVEGSNGNACMVSRTRPTSLEPVCYDPEAVRTLLPIEIRLVESRIAHGDWDAAWAEVHEAIEAGELPLPGRPAMTYMLSSGQRLVSGDDREVGAWKPHFMLYVPYLTGPEVGLSEPTAQAFVAHDGEPLAHLITVAAAFIDPGETP